MDEGVVEEASGAEVPQSPGWFTTPSTGGMAVAVRVVRWGALGWLVLGTPLSLFALASSPHATSVPQVDASRGERGGGDAGPAGFAALYVQTYVSALSSKDGERELAAFLPEAGPSVMGAGEGVVVRAESTAAVRVESVSARYWSVTVAARIVEEGPAGGGSKASSDEDGVVGLRYFQVPVREVAGGDLVAVSLPAEVAGPGGQEAPVLAYGQAREVVRSAALTRTLDAVLAAYVAGKGELAPYLSPGAEMEAISPAPYTRVASTRVAEVGTADPLEARSQPQDGERRRLLVEAEATSASGVGWPLSYAIELQARDGRWEVAALAPAPVLPESKKKEEEGA